MATNSSATPLHVTESIADRKKSRDLATARQSGSAPPEIDVNTNAIINPHNPEFITKRPWYLGGGDEGPSLDHQADQRTDENRKELSLTAAEELVKQERIKWKAARKSLKFNVGMWVEALKKGKKPYVICQIIRIAKKGTVFDLRYEDGQVEHKVYMKKAQRGTSTARIRMTKMGARSIQVNAEEHGKETFDSKRDAYHGYDVVTEQHLETLVEKHAKREAFRKANRIKRTKDDKKSQDKGSDSDSDSDYDSDGGSDSDDEFVQRDEDAKVITSRLARQGGVGGAQMKVTARNLRIREDTAKYLRNLDPNSAYYDPKSRSMRDNPNPEMDPNEVAFAGDNFSRISGDAIGLAQTQVFAWDAEKQTNGSGGGGGGGENAGAASSSIHPQANPSQAELMRKKFTSAEVDLKTQQKRAVLDKYGGSEYLDGGDGLASAAAPTADNDDKREKEAEQRKVRFGVSVQEERYTRDGRLKADGSKSKQNMNLKSKYEEDVFSNGHETVWGSYFHKGAFRWGYGDDHSLMRNSYCTGANGQVANDEANEMKYGTGVAGSAALAQAREMLKAIPPTERTSNGANSLRPTSSKMYGEANQFAEIDQEKVKEALMKQKEDNQEVGDDKKRKYNSMNATNDITEEEMEAYRLKKDRGDDPMTKLASSGELLQYK
jgi:pre-mRNA-processing factor SLU7